MQSDKVEVEPWEETLFALVGITRLCGSCMKRPLEKDDPEYKGTRRLSRHCKQCWERECRAIFDKGNSCEHKSPYYLSFPHSRPE